METNWGNSFILFFCRELESNRNQNYMQRSGEFYPFYSWSLQLLYTWYADIRGLENNKSVMIIIGRQGATVTELSI
jgi:hypothetical protein